MVNTASFIRSLNRFIPCFIHQVLVTHKNTHVRDALDSKRMMITVFLALFPAIFYGMYNVGNQAIPALNQLGNLDQLIANDWHYALLQVH